jgi:S-layer homology domain
MNDPMPPESLPPESAPLSTAVSPIVASEAEARRAEKHKYDEIIAVVVALFGIGGLLFWILGRSNNPFSGAVSGALKRGDTPAADLSTGRSGDAAGNLAANGNGAIAQPSPSAQVGIPITKAKVALPAIAAGAAVAGAAASGADAAPAASPSPVAAVPNNAPSASASMTPKIVEPDVLPSATAARKFSDVTAASPIAPYVDALSSRGVLDQFNDGTLKPNEPITRGEFANLISKAFGKPRIKPDIAFSDIAADSSSKAAVAEATQTGFMTGFPDRSFKPDMPIPRYQMQVAIVTGTAFAPSGDPTQTLAKFSDGSAVPKWATAKVATAIGAGVLPAKDLTALNPEQPATRGEAVVMLHEALVKEGKLPAVK